MVALSLHLQPYQRSYTAAEFIPPIIHCIRRDCCLDTDSFQVAIHQYRDTPDRNMRLSPAICIFGQPNHDFIPIHPGKYLSHKTWYETLSNREEAFRNRHMQDVKRLSAHTCDLTF
ncbi:hypothetical protein PoB_005948200 [Plakobranchus ocellatus]|uniref:Uncharacterized protein n=1 Tax=Plakobranchus ocellatus TaxID=259542 RepID=A0AAV4CMH5_9GAST|nr:hypothetical protein PoB_005948200 [Plakobranchus ocellatus]